MEQLLSSANSSLTPTCRPSGFNKYWGLISTSIPQDAVEPTTDVLLLLLIIFLIVLFFIRHFSPGRVKVMISLSGMMDQRFGGVGGPETYVRGRAMFGKQQFWFLALSSSCCPNRISERDVSVSLCTGLKRPTWNPLTSCLISWSLLAALAPMPFVVTWACGSLHSGQGSPRCHVA